MKQESLYGPEEAQNVIWICLEEDDGLLNNVSLELLSRGRQLADTLECPLVAFWITGSNRPDEDPVFRYGANELLLVHHPLLQTFRIESYTRAATDAIKEFSPSIILFGATPNMRDLAGRLAVRLRTGLNADCTELEVDKTTGILSCQVSGFGGGVLALIEMRNHRPQMATVRPGVFKANEDRREKAGKITKFNIDLNPSDIYTEVAEQGAGSDIDLTQSPVIVAGGRGIDGNFSALRELADLLHGEIGATRPPVDEGFIERERQIGQTGVVCRPKVALACGISGAFHFIVGIQDADTVIAINIDPNAPIFEHADYCIIGDAQEIISQLTDFLGNPDLQPENQKAGQMESKALHE